jgi:hypothetical protein
MEVPASTLLQKWAALVAGTSRYVVGLVQFPAEVSLEFRQQERLVLDGTHDVEERFGLALVLVHGHRRVRVLPRRTMREGWRHYSDPRLALHAAGGIK